MWSKAFVLDMRGTVLSWVSGYSFGRPVRTMSAARERRIACLRGALGSAPASCSSTKSTP
jgi:hypothetical protein